jgi:hypothetical protein
MSRALIVVLRSLPTPSANSGAQSILSPAMAQILEETVFEQFRRPGLLSSTPTKSSLGVNGFNSSSSVGAGGGGSGANKRACADLGGTLLGVVGNVRCETRDLFTLKRSDFLSDSNLLLIGS